MTEDEAKTKWCPSVRFTPETEFSHFASNRADTRANSNLSPHQTTRCVASDCMAWRWYRTHINNPEDPKGDLISSVDVYGYCGLAGHWFEDLRAR